MSKSFTPSKMVYFVRHGQSAGNIAPVFQSADAPLTDTGKEQAAQIAERMSRVEFDALIASPLPRTRDTAEAIAAATGKSIEYSELFVERVKPSEIAGRSYDDPSVEQLSRKWSESLYTTGLRVGDGENFDDLVQRADRALALLEARPENVLAVVTHGYFLRTIVARVLLGEGLTGAAFKHFQTHIEMENTGITALARGTLWNGETVWKLWIYNDHAHLG